MNRFVIITREPRASSIRKDYASAELAKFRLAELGEDYGRYSEEESKLLQAIREIREVVSALGPVLEIERSLLPGTPLLPDDTLIVIGQDGLVANTLRYSKETPIIGVNPDPGTYEGTLLPFSVRTARKYLESPGSKGGCREITLAQAKLSTGAILMAANDIFVGKDDHSSALYKIRHRESEEAQSSSGIIVSTPMGQSGWQRSIIAGGLKLAEILTGQSFAFQFPPIPHNADSLQFWVREPWPSLTTGAGLTAGNIDAQTPLNVTSQMGENGAIFADGMQADSFPFPAGESVEISPARTKGRLTQP